MVAATVTNRDKGFTIAGLLIFSIGAGVGSYYGFGNNLTAPQWGAVVGISIGAGLIGAALGYCISNKTTLIDDLLERCNCFSCD